MLPRVILLALIPILCLSGYSQNVDLARFIEPSIYDGISLFEHQKIKFTWNMVGKVQVEMNEGLNSMDQNQYAEAIHHFNQVLNTDPKFGPAWYYRSVCQKLQRNLLAAEYDMTKASRLLKIPECYIELGNIYYLKRDLGAAKENYEKAVKSNPKLVDAYFKLGCFSINIQNIEEGIRYLNKCTELEPSFVKAYLQLGLIQMRFKKDYRGANQLFTKAIRCDSSNAQTYFWRGLLYLIEREHDSSLADLNKSVGLAPSNSYFRLMRGLLLIDLKDFDNAFTDLRRALIVNKVDEGSSLFGQTVLDKKIDLQNATEYLNRVIYGYDDLTIEFLKMGYCFLLVGNYREAIDNFDRVSRLHESACTIYLKALAYEHMGKHDLAYDTYSRALQLDGDIFDAYKKRAVYKMELKDWRGAFADLKEMRRLQPGSTLTYRLSGFLNYHYGDYRGAVKEMDLFLKADSTDVEALKVRADSKSKLKDYSGSVSDFKRVIALSEDNADIEYLVITNTLQAGDTVRAIDMLKEFNGKYHTLNSEVRLTEVYIEKKDFKKAEANISLLEKLLKNSYSDRDKISYVHYLRSKLKFKRGLNTDALGQINKSLELSQAEEFLFLRARIFFAMSQIEDGRKDLETLKKKGYKEAEIFYAKYDIN
jgi:tetratricopeptide (TPR) repeat protein